MRSRRQSKTRSFSVKNFGLREGRRWFRLQFQSTKRVSPRRLSSLRRPSVQIFIELSGPRSTKRIPTRSLIEFRNTPACSSPPASMHANRGSCYSIVRVSSLLDSRAPDSVQPTNSLFLILCIDRLGGYRFAVLDNSGFNRAGQFASCGDPILTSSN